MARLRVSGPGVPVRAPKPGKPSNVGHDRHILMRPPRLKQLSVGTRDYAKPEQAAEDPLTVQTGGFGRTGML